MDEELLRPRSVVRMALLFEGGLGVLAWAIGFFMLRPPFAQWEWNLPDVLWGVVATLPLIVLLLLITRFPVGPLGDLKQIVEERITPIFRGLRFWDLALISLVAGLGEEMFFRGVIQEVISQRFGPVVGLVVASLLFGLAHPITTTYAVLATVIGLYLGGLWLVTDNLLPPVITHALYDLFALVYLTRSPATSDHATSVGQDEVQNDEQAEL